MYRTVGSSSQTDSTWKTNDIHLGETKWMTVPRSVRASVQRTTYGLHEVTYKLVWDSLKLHCTAAFLQQNNHAIFLKEGIMLIIFAEQIHSPARLCFILLALKGQDVSLYSDYKILELKIWCLKKICLFEKVVYFTLVLRPADLRPSYLKDFRTFFLKTTKTT